MRPLIPMLVSFPLLLTLGGCGSESDDAPQPAPSFAIPETAAGQGGGEQQVLTDNVFEDVDYAFTLQRPSANWVFLKGDQAREMLPNAIMFATNLSDQCFCAMLVEQFQGVELDDYLKLAYSESPIGSAARESEEMITVDGFPGRRFEASATVSGLHFRYVVQVVKRGDYFYQMLGWSDRSLWGTTSSGIRAMLTSLHLLTDREPVIRTTQDKHSDVATTWKLTDGDYTNAVFRFRLKPVEGLVVQNRAGLNQLGANAVAGLEGAGGKFYQAWHIERRTGDDVAPHARTLLDAVAQEFGDVEVSDPEDVEVSGLSALRYHLKNVRRGGAVFDFAETFLIRDEYVYRIQTWWPSVLRDLSLPKLQQASDMVEWLTAEDVAALRAELLASDPGNSVGPYISFRNGTFRDFEFGYTIDLPDGVWVPMTGDAATATSPDARALLHDPENGVICVIVPEDVRLNPDSYHRVLRASLMVPESTPTETVALGDTEVRISRFENTPVEGHHFVLASAARPKRCIQLLMSSTAADNENLQKRADEIIAGFSFPADGVEEIVQEGQTVTDVRLGYSLSTTPGRPISSQVPPQMRAVGSMIASETPDMAVIGLGMCLEGQIDEELSIEGMLTNSPIKFDRTSRSESATTLAGLPAREITFNSLGGQRKSLMKMWVIRRSNSLYFHVLIGPESSDAFINPDPWKNRFTLLD